MRYLLLTALFEMFAALPISAEELVVIVNRANPTVELTHRQLVNLYMGRTQHYPNGTPALPVDQAPDSKARQFFYQTLVGKRVADVNAYWAKLLFTGRASPPRSLENAEMVLQVVRENRDVIGYIESKYLDDTVKVVRHIQ
jgi:ABC-type phosphate transport system substrate-binding protein